DNFDFNNHDDNADRPVTGGLNLLDFAAEDSTTAAVREGLSQRSRARSKTIPRSRHGWRPCSTTWRSDHRPAAYSSATPARWPVAMSSSEEAGTRRGGPYRAASMTKTDLADT